jgi:uncharacterized protein YdeI (YjbR/CyaY-like superfamily)
MKSRQTASKEAPIKFFADNKDWATWLEQNHEASSGIWLRLTKKSPSKKSLTYAEALEEALCYGWIDGQKKSYDDSSWLQKFTPRRPKSIWSKINRTKVEELTKTGRMKPAGLREIEKAKQDGRWAQAYDSQKVATVPGDFQARLNKNQKAKEFFATLNSANRYAILFRIQTAKKAETRARRIEQFIEMLERNEKLH